MWDAFPFFLFGILFGVAIMLIIAALRVGFFTLEKRLERRHERKIQSLMGSYIDMGFAPADARHHARQELRKEADAALRAVQQYG
jgi:hypothetical protein